MKQKEVVKSNIRQKIIERKIEKEIQLGERVFFKDVFVEIGDFCGCSFENVKQMYRGKVKGSLILALKLAEYFDCRVEDLFYIEKNK